MQPKSKSKSRLKNTKTLSPLKSTSTRNLSPNPIPNRSKYSTSPHDSQNRGLKTKLSKSRQKLTQQLDTYTLLIRSRNPIRCLQHNSNISIYCQTQQRLLCANCIYGRTEHKFHRVTPVDKSLDKISRDVETMNRLINRELQTMRRVEERFTESLLQEEDDAHDCLVQLARIYDESHRKLEEGFLHSKDSIISHLQSLRKNHDQLMLELKMQKDNYCISSIAQKLNKDYFNSQELLLYQHSICTAITAQRRFEEKEWVLSNRQILGLGAAEKRKIINVIEVISANFGKK